MRGLQTAWFIAIAALSAVVSIAIATPAIAQDSNPKRDFRALHHWASAGQEDYIPGGLAILLRFSGGDNVITKRRTLTQRRPSDNKVLKRWVVDVSPQGGHDVILLSQLIEGDEPDATLSYLFDKNGRITRVFKFKMSDSIVEISDGSADALGYDIWKLFVRRIPPEHYDK